MFTIQAVAPSADLQYPPSPVSPPEEQCSHARSPLSSRQQRSANWLSDGENPTNQPGRRCGETNTLPTAQRVTRRWLHQPIVGRDGLCDGVTGPPHDLFRCRTRVRPVGSSNRAPRATRARYQHLATSIGQRRPPYLPANPPLRPDTPTEHPSPPPEIYCRVEMQCDLLRIQLTPHGASRWAA